MNKRDIEPCHDACQSAFELKTLQNLLYEDTYISPEGDVVVFTDSELFHIISDMHIKHRHDKDYRIV